MISAPLSATVIGLGPAGRILAHRAAARGWDVTAFDPAGGTLPSTIGLWAHQIPGWAPQSLIAADFFPTVVLADGASVPLGRKYCVIDNDCLANLRGFKVVERKATTADCVGKATVTATGGAAAAYGPEGQARQLAIGHIFEVGDLPEGVAEPVLMDFRQVGDDRGPASFSYRIPLGRGRFLIEETILAAAVPLKKDSRTADEKYLLDLLRRRQSRRLEDLGVNPRAAVQEEVVSFPLLSMKDRSQCLATRRRLRRPTAQSLIDVSFGFAGGWMHPATGYSVGPVLDGVDSFLTALEREARCGKRGAFAASVSRIWLLRLRERGLAALLHFNRAETLEFFSAFFSLHERHIFAYLTGTTSSATMRAMLGVAVPLWKRNPRLLGVLILGFLQGCAAWRAPLWRKLRKK